MLFFRSYNWLVLLVLCAGLLFITHWFSGRSRETAHQSAVTNFEFADLNGVSYQLEDFKSKKLIVHFWATWCLPCIVELPELLKYMQQHPDVTLLAFSADAERDALDRFLKKMPSPPNVIHIWDQKGIIGRKHFNLEGYPESFFFAPGLTKRRHVQGNVNWNDAPEF